MRKSIPAVIMIAGLSVAALAGCSAGAQSTADACKIANTEMTAFSAELQESMSGLQSGDMDAVGKAMSDMEAKLTEVAGKISNAEVKEAMTGLSASVKEFAGLFDGIDMNNPESLTELSTEMQGITADMQAAGAKVQELCPAS